MKTLESVLERQEEKCAGFMLSKDNAKVSRALVANLSTKEFQDFGIPRSWCETYVSGPALASRIWAHFCDESESAEDAPMVLATGAASSSLMPFTALASFAFRSPQSGTLAINTCVCPLGNKLDSLGYAALVIIGRNPRSGVLELTEKGARTDISEYFVNMGPSQLPAFYPSADSCILSTGRAAEKGVPFASAMCDGRLTGRGGLGCVMGMKNLKALVITTRDRGQRKNLTKERKAAFRKLEASCDESSVCRLMRKTGTCMALDEAIRAKAVPSNGFSGLDDARLVHLTSSELQRRRLSAPLGCELCPVQCRLCTQDGSELPPCDAVMMLGSNLGCFDIDAITERYSFCMENGIDWVSAGNIMGSLHTSPDKVMPTLAAIARGEVPVCSDPMLTRGIECGPFDYRGSWTRVAHDACGRWFDLHFGAFCTKSPSTAAKLSSFNETLVIGLQSLGVSEACLYSCKKERTWLRSRVWSILPMLETKGLDMTPVLDALGTVLGRTVTLKDVLVLGRRARTLVDTISAEAGFSRIPDRFCTDAGDSAVVPFVRISEEYRKLREYSLAVQGAGLDDGTSSLA